MRNYFVVAGKPEIGVGHPLSRFVSQGVTSRNHAVTRDCPSPIETHCHRFEGDLARATQKPEPL